MDEVEAKVRKFEEQCGIKLYDWQRELLTKSISSGKKLYIMIRPESVSYHKLLFTRLMQSMLDKEGEKK